MNVALTRENGLKRMPQPPDRPPQGGHLEPPFGQRPGPGGQRYSHPESEAQYGYPPQYPGQQRAPKKSRGCLIVGLVIGGIVLLILIVLAIVIGVAASRMSPSRSRRQGKGTITIESAEWKKKGFIDPESGNYLVLDVVVRGQEGTVSYNPLYFSVQDEDGREYDIAFGADAEPSLKSGDLEPGKKARGYIAFDVKKGPVTLSVTDELLQDVGAMIRTCGWPLGPVTRRSAPSQHLPEDDLKVR